MSVTSGTIATPHGYLQAQARWHPAEIVFWLATLLPYWLFPDYLVLASQIAITALFALSLDLILGYAGIVSLGHAAFFGTGAYAAALFAKFVMPDPLVGLVVALAIVFILTNTLRLTVLARRQQVEIMSKLGARNVAELLRVVLDN